MQAINTLRRHAGDTIVEVMIVLAILGLAIGISYGTANRSLLDARQAQENAQASERVQAQIENLRVMASNPATVASLPNPDYIFQPGQNFCTYIDAAGVYHVQLITIAIPHPALCHDDNLYDVSIQFLSLSASPPGGRFTVVATWPDVQGEGNDTVTMSYRYYQLP